MNPPRPVKFRGTVEGQILEVSHIDIDCPLIGTQITVYADGVTTVTVDEKEVLRVAAGGFLSVHDQRTGYSHMEG